MVFEVCSVWLYYEIIRGKVSLRVEPHCQCVLMVISSLIQGYNEAVLSQILSRKFRVKVNLKL